MKFLVSSLITFLFATTIFAQKTEYSSLLIPDSLKQNANAENEKIVLKKI